ncbi:MAG: Crp/Fnr family transcriptional regulator [Bacteroidota bacterium]
MPSPLDLKRIFPTLTDQDLLQRMLAVGRVERIAAGTVILEQDSYVKLVPLVVDGLVKVLQPGAEHDILMYYIQPGESCIMSLTACVANEKSKVTAIVEEDADLLLLPAREVVQWQGEFSCWNDFVMTLYRKRFVNLLDGFNSVVYDNLDNRLTAYLNNRAQKTGSTSLKITHQQVANEIGSAREVVSRLLKSLEAEGKVALSRGMIRLTDRPS